MLCILFSSLRCHIIFFFIFLSINFSLNHEVMIPSGKHSCEGNDSCCFPGCWLLLPAMSVSLIKVSEWSVTLCWRNTSQSNATSFFHSCAALNQWKYFYLCCYSSGHAHRERRWPAGGSGSCTHPLSTTRRRKSSKLSPRWHSIAMTARCISRACCLLCISSSSAAAALDLQQCLNHVTQLPIFRVVCGEFEVLCGEWAKEN